MKFAIANRYALTGAAALSLILTARVAMATPQPDFQPKSVVVSYSDLDLSSRKDVSRLYGRIKRAAQEACDNPPLNELTRLVRYKSCLDQAITDAVARVNVPQLTSMHEAEMHRLSRG
jgi:UrcA family protein